MKKIYIILILATVCFGKLSTSFAQNNYFVSKDGTGNFSNINQVNNASLKPGDIVSFKSGEQFADDVLKCQKGVTYTTYGGSTKAIIGDSLKVGFGSTIDIDVENVTLSNLKIYGYKDANRVIVYTKGGLTIKNCDIFGSVNSHTYKAVGIKCDANGITKPIEITNNRIKHFYKGIYINQPYNIDISYNDISYSYKYNGVVGVGGDPIFFSSGETSDAFDCAYTANIHHNKLHKYEHTAIWIGEVSRVIFEYNEVTDNLDERLFYGGTKSGGVGKVWDNTNQTLGSLGHVLRYNYIHDIKKYGQAGYTYSRPTPTQIEAGEVQVVTTNNGQDNPIYQAAYSDGTDFNGYIGNLMSGQGYANYWIHNNVIDNVTLVALNKGRNYPGDNTSLPVMPFVSDYRAYYVNNTILSSGETYWTTNTNGIMTSQGTSQSPDMVVNNIVDYNSSTARMAGRWKESELYLDYNIYTKQSGTTTTLPPLNSNYATYYQAGEGQNLASAAGEQYLTDPNWVDTTSMIFAPNIGINGVWIPDVRIRENGNAHNKGMDYNKIGDTYTVLGKKHELGKDPTGRSFAYDILGNLRTTNDIGAVGVAEGNPIVDPPSNSSSSTPVINSHPVNISANLGADVTFTVLAESEDEIGYQWWKHPYVNSSSKILDNEKYSGATTNKLTIKNVNAQDAEIKYLCEVYLKKDPSNHWVNSSPASIILQNSNNANLNNELIVFLEAPYKDGSMITNLNNSKVLPNSQPFNTDPWNYINNEKYDKLESNYVDWLLVELRNDLKTTKYSKAAILTSEGKVINSDGSNFYFTDIDAGEYYLVIKHRNHLDVISSVKLQINNNEAIGYDFTDSQYKAFGNNPMADLGNGKFGLFAGDGNSDGVINNLDFGTVANFIPSKGYLQGDLDMNGIINVLDYSLINKNILKRSQVPK